MPILKKELGGSFLKDEKVDAPLLLLGLVYREVCRSMEIEPGAPTDSPNHLVDSSFGVRELRQIDKLVNDIRLPSLV